MIAIHGDPEVGVAEETVTGGDFDNMHATVVDAEPLPGSIKAVSQKMSPSVSKKRKVPRTEKNPKPPSKAEPQGVTTTTAATSSCVLAPISSSSSAASSISSQYLETLERILREAQQREREITENFQAKIAVAHAQKEAEMEQLARDVAEQVAHAGAQMQ